MKISLWLGACFTAILLVLRIDPVVSLSSASGSGDVSRREAFSIAGGAVGFGIGSGSGLYSPSIVNAAGSSSASGPVAILGASGRTGALCVTACLKRSIPVRALTRTGTWQDPTDSANTSKNSLLSVQACDVKDPLAIEQSVEGCRAVIYAASASKKGGNAQLIDNQAVVAAGNACLKANVPRYVVLSSTATTRPKSAGYVFTNVFVGGNIMGEKRLGEEGVISAYSSATSSASSYTILRPGGLEEPKENTIQGPSSLEVSQGDTLTGIISRADLGEFTVELALSNAPNVKNTALEVYYRDSAQPCEKRFKGLLESGGVRLHGDTYAGLLQGIEAGVDFIS